MGVQLFERGQVRHHPAHSDIGLVMNIHPTFGAQPQPLSDSIVAGHAGDSFRFANTRRGVGHLLFGNVSRLKLQQQIGRFVGRKGELR